MTRTNRQGCPVIPLAALLCALAVLGAGAVISGGYRLVPGRRAAEVLIYYANENSPNEAEARNYATISDWLRSTENQKLRKLAESLDRDMRQFPAAVDAEIVVFRGSLPKWQGGGGAVLTNRLVRSGKFLVWRPGQTGFEEVPIAVPATDHLVLAANPLSRPEVFALALREIGRQFDPARHEFVLVTKSHGSRKMALTPRLVVRAADVSREELLAFAAGERPAGGPPSWAERVGIPRPQYFALLAEAGTEGMRFPLVFTESCEGVLDQELKVQLPENVGRMYTTGHEEARYQNLDYPRVFERCGEGVTLAESLEEQLAASFPGITRSADAANRTWRMLYCLPLVLWLGWLVARYWRRGRASNRSA